MVVDIHAGQRLADSIDTHCLALRRGWAGSARRPLHLRCANLQFCRSSGAPPCDSCTTWSTVRDIGCVLGSVWSTHWPQIQQSDSSANTFILIAVHAVPERPLLYATATSTS